MRFKTLAMVSALAATLFHTAQAQTEIQWWHSMTAVNNEWVNDLAKQFNESQKDYKIVPTFKGEYPESMTAATRRFLRSGWNVGATLAPAEWLADTSNLDDLSGQLDDENPDIVLVGLGTPKQELVAQYLRRGSSTSIFICVGAGIDFLSGEKHRAPVWMQKAGLEWLHRILSEPGRLLKRYLSDVPLFIGVLRNSLRA